MMFPTVVLLSSMLCLVSASDSDAGARRTRAQVECNQLCAGKQSHQNGYAVAGENLVCLCHGDGHNVPHSVLEYECKWDTSEFGVNLHTFGYVRTARLTQRALASGRSSSSMEASMLELPIAPRAACPAPQPETESQTFSYVDPQTSMRVSDGKLYYETRVEVVEESANSNCNINSLHPFKYLVTVSCCADPSDDFSENLTPPVHQYCDFTDCADPNVFTCNCIQLNTTDNQQRFHISAGTSGIALPAEFGFELDSLLLYPDAVPRADLPKLALISAGVVLDVPIHLEQSPPAGGARSDGSIQLNKFVFAGPHRENNVNATCGVKYCLKDPAHPNPRGYALCKGVSASSS